MWMYYLLEGQQPAVLGACALREQDEGQVVLDHRTGDLQGSMQGHNTQETRMEMTDTITPAYTYLFHGVDCSGRVGAVDPQVVSQHVELPEQRVPDDPCDDSQSEPGTSFHREFEIEGGLCRCYGTLAACPVACVCVCMSCADLLFGDSDGASGSEPHDEEDVQRRRVVADEDSPRLEVLRAFHFDWVPQDPQLQKALKSNTCARKYSICCKFTLTHYIYWLLKNNIFSTAKGPGERERN